MEKDIEDLKKFIINCERKNQTAQKESIESWQTLYSQITDELYSTNKPTLARLKVLQVQTNDFLIAVRDVMVNLRKPGNVISKDFLKTEKKYIDKFENLQTVIQQKIEIRNQQEPEQEPERINPEYLKFWMQFTKNNPKTSKPYLNPDDVVIFLNQSFRNDKGNKTFNPDVTNKEMYHAAWLFYRANKKDFKKIQIAKIMKLNFPYHFSGTLDEETKKIRDGLDSNKRIFHKI
jgi:hypothetical protein